MKHKRLYKLRYWVVLLSDTGTAFTSFVMDKTLDAQWDKTMRQFLTKKGIACLEK